MKKILLILIPVLILGGVGVWYFKRQSSEDTKEEGGGGVTISREPQEKISGSIRELIGMGTAMKCTWDMGEESSGTSWIKGENVYSEVKTSQGQFNSITKDACVWTWQEGNTSGMKICYDTTEEIYEAPEVEGETPEEEPIETEVMTPPTDIEYNCEKTSISDSRFEPPTEVTFTSMDELMEGSLEELQGQMEEMMPEGF